VTRPARKPLPPPLPPETRTVGQLVGETVRLYGARFWPSIALGVPIAVAATIIAALPGLLQLAAALTVGAAAVGCAYAAAIFIVCDIGADSRLYVRASALAAVIALPLPFLGSAFVLPAVFYLAVLGWAVPALVVERLGVGKSLRRSVELARADFVHAAGGLATLVIVAILTSLVLFFLLRGQGEATIRVAGFLCVLVISPLLLLGGALLYGDQAARVGSASRARRS